MANPRQRRKRHGHTKVKSSRRQQKNLKKMPPIRGPKALQDAWDKEKTVRQNYAALGLVESFSVDGVAAAAPGQLQLQADSQPGGAAAAPLPPGRGRILRDADGNVIGVELPRELDEDAEPSHPQGSSGEANPVVKELESLAAKAAPKSRHASRGEVSLMRELQKAHGGDYDAMAKDRRRNVWQRTAGELRRSMAKCGLIA